VRDFLDIEETAGARSTSFVVPCAWPLDHGLLQQLHDRGHEIGVHGYDHANRTPFAAPEVGGRGSTRRAT
jgi:peptidoglycan/xylan/chitin deacetylase (PgdA/CDA1 family)